MYADGDQTKKPKFGDILLILLIMILIGTERLQQIDYVKDDPLFRRIIRLTRIPHRTKHSTALKQFTSDSPKAPGLLFCMQWMIENLESRLDGKSRSVWGSLL